MNKLIKYGMIAGGVLCAVNGLDNRLETTHYTVASDKIPEEFNGFKIAHLSDMHSESIPNIYSAVKSLHPDIIVCTGDMVDDKGDYDFVVSEIKNLMNIAPVYIITGNHDLWRNDFPEFQREIENTGAMFLRNERIRLEKCGAWISLSGLDDPFSHDAYNINKNMDYALSTLGEPEGFEILLFHRANLLDKLCDKGFDLILSGHMHGGQFRIPKVGGVFSPKSSIVGGGRMLFPKYFGGRYSFKKTEMIVSRGLGNPMVIPRVFNRPELICVKLESI